VPTTLSDIPSDQGAPKVVIRAGGTDVDVLAAPMVQILWLDQGRLVEAPPPSPVSALQAPPPGWYSDQLRFWNGESWTDEVRPIVRPSPAMRVVYEVVDGAETATVPEVGLLGMPPAIFESATRRSSVARETKSGLISGLMGALVVIGTAIAAVTLLVAVGIVFNL
jgi:hypothetical protein